MVTDGEPEVRRECDGRLVFDNSGTGGDVGKAVIDNVTAAEVGGVTLVESYPGDFHNADNDRMEY